MLQSIFNDVQGVFTGVFLSGDFITIAVAIVSVLAAALATRSIASLPATTVLALLIFIGALALRSIFLRSSGPEQDVGATTANQTEALFNQLMSLQFGTFLSYFLAFMLMTLVLFVIKSVLAR